MTVNKDEIREKLEIGYQHIPTKWVKDLLASDDAKEETIQALKANMAELESDLNDRIRQQAEEIERLREVIKEAKAMEWELAGEATPLFMILHHGLITEGASNDENVSDV